MNSRAAFEEAFRNLGTPTALPEDVNPSQIEIPYDVREAFPEIYCDFIENPKFNALACIYKGHEFVAFFTGIVNVVTSYCATILSDRAMFPDIGDPAKESADLFAMNLDVRRTHPESAFSTMPRCPIRTAAFRHIVWCMHYWLHAHEVSHILQGHLDLLRDEFDLSVYQELPVMPLSVEEEELRKVLELQADQSASLTSLYRFRRRVADDSAANGKFEADLLWSIAIDLLLVLFELIKKTHYPGISATHPPPTVRWLNIKLNVSEYAVQSGIPNINISTRKPAIIRQIVDWFETNKLATPGVLFLPNDLEHSWKELYATWDTLKPYDERLLAYRERRGRAVPHVSRIPE